MFLDDSNWVKGHAAAAWIVTRDEDFARQCADLKGNGFALRLSEWKQSRDPVEKGDWPDLLLTACRYSMLRATGLNEQKQRVEIPASSWIDLSVRAAAQPYQRPYASPVIDRADIGIYTELAFEWGLLVQLFPPPFIEQEPPPSRFDVSLGFWPLTAVLVWIAERDFERVAILGNRSPNAADIYAQTANACADVLNVPAWSLATDKFSDLQYRATKDAVTCFADKEVVDGTGAVTSLDPSHDLSAQTMLSLKIDLGASETLLMRPAATPGLRERYRNLQFDRDNVMRLWPPKEVAAEDTSVDDVGPENGVETNKDAARLKAVKVIEDAARTANPDLPFISKQTGATLLRATLDPAELAALWPSGVGRQQAMRDFVGSIAGSRGTAGRRPGSGKAKK